MGEPKRIKKDEARAMVDLGFKPLEFVVTMAQTSAKTEEKRRNIADAKTIVKLLQETFQDIAVLAAE